MKNYHFLFIIIIPIFHTSISDRRLTTEAPIHRRHLARIGPTSEPEFGNPSSLSFKLFYYLVDSTLPIKIGLYFDVLSVVRFAVSSGQILVELPSTRGDLGFLQAPLPAPISVSIFFFNFNYVLIFIPFGAFFFIE